MLSQIWQIAMVEVGFSDDDGILETPDLMPKRIKKLARSLKELGDKEVTGADFMELLNKDIRDLEISRSMRKLGSIRVTEWDFKDVLPAVNKLAQQEVDIPDLLKRTAQYKVMEWDFRSMLPASASKQTLDPEATQALIQQMKDFLNYLVGNLLEDPDLTKIRGEEIAPGVLNFKLVMTKSDASKLIGMQGQTAAAIRGLMKAAGARHGVHVLLKIHSFEEEAAIKRRR